MKFLSTAFPFGHNFKACFFEKRLIKSLMEAEKEIKMNEETIVFGASE